MYFFTIFITSNFINIVCALKFTLPLNSLKSDLSGYYNKENDFKKSQKAMSLNHYHGNGKSTQMPVTENLTMELGYFTNIGIGSPPQYFSVLLDISAPDMFISSIKCDSCSHTNKPFIGYDSAASSTHYPNDTSTRIDYGTMYTSGILSQDTLHLGSLVVNDQLFQEALEVGGGGPSFEDTSIIHGILGMTPSSEGSVQQLANPFINAVTQGLLNHKLFALKLAEPGQLNIGDIDHDLFKGDLKHMPLLNNAGSFLAKGRWQVAADFLAMGPQQDIKWSLQGYTATLTTMWPLIYLPDQLAWDLNIYLGFEELMFLPPSIDCELRNSLPDVTINLGGHDLVLSSYDYTIEWHFGRGQSRCVSTFIESELDESKGKQVILGSAFLRKFYTVFDLDSDTIAFASLA